MNTCISINSITLEKLIKRCKLTSNGTQGIVKAAQQRSSTWSVLNKLARKIEFRESNNTK